MDITEWGIYRVSFENIVPVGKRREMETLKNHV